MVPRLAIAAVAAAVLFAVGCDSKSRKGCVVKGKLVVKGGGAYSPKAAAGGVLPPGDPGIRIKFTETKAVSEPVVYYATIDPDSGTFDVPGPDRRGIPAGSYIVTVFGGAAGTPATGKAKSPPGTSLDGNEIARKEVTVTDAGLLDLEIEVASPPKK